MKRKQESQAIICKKGKLFYYDYILIDYINSVYHELLYF